MMNTTSVRLAVGSNPIGPLGEAKVPWAQAASVIAGRSRMRCRIDMIFISPLLREQLGGLPCGEVATCQDTGHAVTRVSRRNARAARLTIRFS
jgi:hypothetical protein